MTSFVGDRAVVLGGSIAGMLTARVLSDAYSEVVIVDRDELTGTKEARRGVPQGCHAHGLLAKGQEIFEEFFPGFTDELIAAGIPVGDFSNQIRWYFNGYRLRPAETSLRVAGITRPVLEHHIRGRVNALANVSFAEGYDIVGPTATKDSSRVTGVRVRSRDDGADQQLDADLVIDTTGRGSRAPTWLTAMGYPQVSEDRVKVGIGYTSRRYRWRTDPFNGDMSINPVATPLHPRGAFLHTLGADLCLLSLTGILDDHPPTDPQGFLAFAKSLPVPDVYDAIRDAEPLDAPVAFKFPASQRRRYERMARFPEGFLVAGDAVCSFNPVYAQGMAVSGLQALTLRSHLMRGAAPRPQAYFRDIAKAVDVPWDMAAGGDLAFPGVEGERTVKVRMGNAYLARLLTAAVNDSDLTSAFLRVAGLIDPPQALMRPSLAVRVFRAPWKLDRHHD